MKELQKITKLTGTLFMVVSLLYFLSTSSCVQFEPEGFLFVSTDTINMEMGDKGTYEFEGSIVNIGEEEITDHGFSWAETVHPILSDDSTSLGETDTKGGFTSAVTGMEAQHTYYVRAYAITSEGIFYGNEKSFVASDLTVPTVRTEEVTHFDLRWADCRGEVVLEGTTPVTERGVCWDTIQKPSLADHVASEGSGAGSFEIRINDLEINTTYYVKAYAINEGGVSYGKEVSFRTLDMDEVSDYNGNIYSTVKIGEQTWMKRNLRVTHYADGTPIQEVREAWNYLDVDSKAYCWYANNAVYSHAYGALYTWNATMNGAESSDKNPSEVQGVCPDGWHVPSDQEWQELEIYLGMDPAEADTIVFRERGEDFGGKLKETSYAHWRSPNTGATNLSGLTAVPGGYRNPYGDFRYLTRSGFYWTSTLYDPDRPLVRGLSYVNTYIDRDYNNNFNAASVRCIQND